MIKLIDILNEEITVSKPVEDSFLTKSLNALSSFIKGKELTDFLNKIKTVAKFNNFTLKFLKGTEGANQFIIDIFNEEEKVGRFVAFVYKDKNTNKYSLQIQKVEVYPEYKGKSIMRTFYQDFNKSQNKNVALRYARSRVDKTITESVERSECQV